jgi:hypothetical protein
MISYGHKLDMTVTTKQELLDQLLFAVMGADADLYFRNELPMRDTVKVNMWRSEIDAAIQEFNIHSLDWKAYYDHKYGCLRLHKNRP